MTHSNTDKIGWGNPPVHHRFRKGQSGNPRGRPRRSKRVEDAILKVLNRKVKFGDKPMTIAQALINRLRRETLAGELLCAACPNLPGPGLAGRAVWIGQ